MTQEKQQSIADVIREKIAAGDVRKLPRMHFVVRTVLRGLVLITVSVVAFFVASFVLFVARLTGAWYAPTAGIEGVAGLLSTFPWVLALIVAAAVIGILLLAKAFRIVWQKPLVYSFVVAAILVATVSFAVAETPLHNRLLDRAERQTLPVAGAVYRHYGDTARHATHMARVVEADEGLEELYVQMRGGKVLQVATTDRTRVSDKTLTVGDVLLIIGRAKGDTMHAVAIKKINDPRELRRIQRYMVLPSTGDTPTIPIERLRVR